MIVSGEVRSRTYEVALSKQSELSKIVICVMALAVEVVSPRVRPPFVVLVCVGDNLVSPVLGVEVGSGEVSGCMSQLEGILVGDGEGLVVGVRLWLRIVRAIPPMIRMATRPVRSDFICPILYTMESNYAHNIELTHTGEPTNSDFDE